MDGLVDGWMDGWIFHFDILYDKHMVIMTAMHAIS